jgi:uncharacterized protein (TIGR03435 family)
MKLTLALLLTPLVFAQAPKRLEFEVASVRPSVPNQGNGAQTPAAARVDPSQIRLTYFTMRDFITRAYAVKAYQVVGPEWIMTDRFDIVATLPEGATQAQVPAMLQSLLEDRFGLKFHKSQKEFEVYTLGRSKRPLTLTEVPPRDTGGAEVIGVAPRPGNGVALNTARGGLFIFADNKLEGKGLSMDVLANNLASFVGFPTINRTDMTGFYDIQLELDEEDFGSMMARAAANRGVQLPPEVAAQLAGMSNPSFHGALDKVGLKLEKGKAPMEVLNIDELRQRPTEN